MHENHRVEVRAMTNKSILMDDPDRQSLLRKLDDFSEHLDARVRDMAQRGEFSDVRCGRAASEARANILRQLSARSVD